MREIIKENGKIFEKFDLTPMQGRIVACLMVCDPPEKTFEELVLYFKASKSSISNSLNYLLRNRLIRYRTLASDRKRYFSLTGEFFRIYFSRVLSNVAEMKEFAYRTVAARSPVYPVADENILILIEHASRFQESLETTLESLKGDQVSL